MYSAMLVFVVAVGAMSVFILTLSRRTERRRPGWGHSRRSLISSDGSGLVSNTDGWAYPSRSTGSETFSPEHHSSGHHSDGCNASDGGTSGSMDHGGGSGGGGDGGDGGGGGSD